MQANNSNQIAGAYNTQLASKFILALGYTLPLITIVWWVIKKAKGRENVIYFEMLDFWIMTVPLLLALVIALWIALRRSLSRHNAAFISMLCALCCFPVFTAVANSEYLKADLLALIGKEGAILHDVEGEYSSSSSGSSSVIVDSTVMTDAKREELRMLEEELKREKEEFLRQKKSGITEGIEPKVDVADLAIQKAKAALAAKKKAREAAAKALKQAEENLKNAGE